MLVHKLNPSMYVTCSSSECNLIANNCSQNDNSFFTVYRSLRVYIYSGVYDPLSTLGKIEASFDVRNLEDCKLCLLIL